MAVPKKADAASVKKAGSPSGKGSSKSTGSPSGKMSPPAAAKGGKEATKAAVQVPVSGREASKKAVEAVKKSMGVEKKAIVNRNEYEMVGDPTETAKGKGPAVVNRNIYEAVGGTGDEAKKTDGSGRYKIMGTDDDGAGPTAGPMGKAEEGEMSDDSAREKKRRRRKRLEEEAELMGRTRMIVIGFSTLMVIVLVVAVVVFAALLFIHSKRPGRVRPRIKGPPSPIGLVTNATYGFDECRVAYKTIIRATDDDDCYSVVPASVSSRLCTLDCIMNLGRLFDKETLIERYHSEDVDIKHLLKPGFQPKVHLENVTTTKAVFCQDKYDRQKMVCMKGQCAYEYDGKAEIYEMYGHKKAEGKWFDACDSDESQCWDTTFDTLDDDRMALFNSPIFSRNICLSDPAMTCKKEGVSAVIYMQRMECDMNPDRVGDFCDFSLESRGNLDNGPLRLFKCADCPAGRLVDATKACKDKGYEATKAQKQSKYPCLSVCLNTTDNQTKIVTMPDGAYCDQHTQPGHCLGGTCFFLNTKNTKDKIDSLDVCKKKQAERRAAAKKPRFQSDSTVSPGARK